MKTPVVLHGLLALLLALLLLEKRDCDARPVRNCCLKTTEHKVRLEALKKYVFQKKPLCPVNALRFTTERDAAICSDPSSPWAVKAKDFLDKKRRTAQGTARQATTLRPEAQRNSTSANSTSVLV